MKSKFKKLMMVSAAGFFLPVATHAATLMDVIATARNIVDSLIPLFITLALVYFIWGVAQIILNSDNEEARSDGRSKMIWGVIALFVIVSVWGLVGFIGFTIGVGQGGTVDLPTLPKPAPATTP